jgi:hypothetical protein
MDSPESDTLRLRLLWATDGRAVALLAEGKPLGFLIAGEKQGTSRNLARTCAWGNAWDQARYDKFYAAGDRSTAYDT